MLSKRCSNCYFGDKCRSSHVCDDYAPIEEISDLEVEIMVEEGRREFYREWLEYIDECSD